MNLKKISLTLSCILFGAITSIHAQTIAFNSGDTEVDASLNEINVQAKTDLTAFKSSLKIELNLASEKATLLLKTMQPAEVYMLALISKISLKPVELVSASYVKNKSKGWGAIAKEMGIKPGSEAFHKLKDATKSKHEKMKGKENKPEKNKVKAKEFSNSKPMKSKGKTEEKVVPSKLTKEKTELKVSPGKSGK